MTKIGQAVAVGIQTPLALRVGRWCMQSSSHDFPALLLLSTISRRLNVDFWRRRRHYSSSKGHVASDPLRILFCGSDEFSCASLRALDEERRLSLSTDPMIESIEVLVRPGKLTGRGLKTVRHVPLQGLAEELGLRVHVRDTFTGWSPPTSVNLIVAVSFGLFVPKRLLRAAQYGGLNIHPSMLPDLRGPAPVHHALLLNRPHTGVTLQTLDEASFDHGIVLKQTPSPGIAIPSEASVASLLERLAPLGAKMLLDGLREGVHIPPHRDVVWTPLKEGIEIAHAPKLGPADRQIDWAGWTAGEMVRRHAVLGPLWGVIGVEKQGQKVAVRVILTDFEAASFGDGEGEKMGSFPTVGEVQWVSNPSAVEGAASSQEEVIRTRVVSASNFKGEDRVLVKLPSGGSEWLRVGRVKVEGKDFKPAKSVFRALAV